MRAVSADASSGTDVRSAANVDAGMLADFFRQTWNPTATAETVAAWQADTSESRTAAAHALTFSYEGRIIGYLGSMPTRFWNGSTDHDGRWLKGFMVLPEHRNGPVGYRLLKDMTRFCDIGGAVVVAASAARLFEALGYHKLGLLSNRILPLNAGAVASRVDPERLGGRLASPRVRRFVMAAQKSGVAALFGKIADAGYRCWWFFTGLREATLQCQTGGWDSVTGAELDALWQRTRAHLSAAPVRDATYLRDRYPDGADAPYTILLAREAGTLVGLAVVRQPSSTDERLAGLRVATLSDIVFPLDRMAVGRALITAARRIATKLGGDALLCSATHDDLERALARAGFVAMPPTIQVLFRAPADVGLTSIPLGQWWLLRGDSNADEGL